MGRALIILAAGQGTRMNSELPKVLHTLAGAPLLQHAMTAGASLAPDRMIVVTGPGMPGVEALARDHGGTPVTQKDRLGTGHAVLKAKVVMEGYSGDAFVLYGDTPFVRPETLAEMAKARRTHDVVVLGFESQNPGRYGRLVMSNGQLDRIVEAKDATDEERAITLCNSGVISADAEKLFDLLDGIGNDNAAGEFYLTDIVGLARERGLTTTAVICDEGETLGIDSRAGLAAAEAAFQTRARAAAMGGGATLLAPETVFFSHDTKLGRDVIVEQNVVFGPGVSVEDGAHIKAFSHLEGAHIGAGAIVGPYARLRPGTDLASRAKIGNFVEVKAAQIGEGAKVNHLTYIGDASIGSKTNVGAGTVTCNYDGVMKHQTDIGAGAFIGSNTLFVAPVRVGDAAMTATGSVITEDVPEGALAVARTRQENKPGLAIKIFEKLRAAKALMMKKAG